MSKKSGDRCPGGYLLNQGNLCGRSGNNCRDYCAFEYRRHTIDGEVDTYANAMASLGIVPVQYDRA